MTTTSLAVTLTEVFRFVHSNYNRAGTGHFRAMILLWFNMRHVAEHRRRSRRQRVWVSCSCGGPVLVWMLDHVPSLSLVLFQFGPKSSAQRTQCAHLQHSWLARKLISSGQKSAQKDTPMILSTSMNPKFSGSRTNPSWSRTAISYDLDIDRDG